MNEFKQPWYSIDTWWAKYAPSIRFWFYERIGQRYQGQIYVGHGSITERRGWTIFGRVAWWDDCWS